MCPGGLEWLMDSVVLWALGGLARLPWMVAVWMDSAGCPLSLGERKKVGHCETWLHNPAIALAKLYPFPKSEEEGEMITIENS